MVESPATATAHTVDEGGFSLVETLVSLVVISFIFLAIAQMIGTGVFVNRASEDLTKASILATDKMEEVRNEPYDDLTPGGDLNANAAGYFDTEDTNGDGNVELTRRWQIVDNGDSKTVRVRVLSSLATTGPAKETTLVALLAEP